MIARCEEEDRLTPQDLEKGYRMKKVFKNIKFQIYNLNFFIGILFGVILSLSVTFMIMSGSINFDAFFDTGNYCEIDSYPIMKDILNAKILSLNEIELVGDETNIVMASDKQICFYKYLTLYLSDIDSKSTSSALFFFDQEGNLLQSKPIRLQNGKNVITFPNKKVYKVIFQFHNQSGQKIKFDKIVSSERLYETSMKKGFALFGLSFLIYILLIMRIFLKLAKKIDVVVLRPLIICLQKIWMKASMTVNLSVSRISKKQRKVIRIACFLWIILDQQYIIKFGRYSDPEVYRFFIARICIVLLILALTNIGNNMKILDWNRPIVKSWFALSICMCISDFVIPKRLMYTGYWQLLFFGFFFWTWANMEHPLDILRDLAVAFEITFILSCFYCFIFEKLSTSYYVGTMRNSNTFGEYMAIAIAIFSGLIFEEFYKKRNWNRLVLLIFELLIAVYFLWLSQCRTAMLTTLICCVLLFLGVVKNKRHKNLLLKFLIASVIFALCLLPVWRGVNFIISHNSGQAVAEEDTKLDWDKASETVMAASLQDSKLIDKFKNAASIDAVTSGRINIYRTYLMKSNLLGHPGKEKIFGREFGAHNSILMISYRYGVIAAIPYVTLLALLIVYSIYYSAYRIKEKESYALLLTNLILTVSLIGLLDDQEHPMAYLTWFLFYFLLGFFFQDGLRYKNDL
jgi:hypothetical protein